MNKLGVVFVKSVIATRSLLHSGSAGAGITDLQIRLHRLYAVQEGDRIFNELAI